MKKWLSYYNSYFSECSHHRHSTENALCVLLLFPWKHFKAINNTHGRRNVVAKRQLAIGSRATGQIHFSKLQGNVQILLLSCNCVLSTIICSKWAISQGEEICFVLYTNCWCHVQQDGSHSVIVFDSADLPAVSYMGTNIPQLLTQKYITQLLEDCFLKTCD